jgi:DnaJ like chaperone protein
LGVTPESSAAEIKRAYRKLISQNHPDKLAARGLPESMRAVAEERSREINSAYDLIKAARSDVK